MQKNEPTSFQVKCITECKRFLSQKSINNAVFNEKIGKQERYFIASFEAQQHHLDIYIYSDEAGFMLDEDKWTICEKPDYSSEESLIGDFIRKLMTITQKENIQS